MAELQFPVLVVGRRRTHDRWQEISKDMSILCETPEAVADAVAFFKKASPDDILIYTLAKRIQRQEWVETVYEQS